MSDHASRAERYRSKAEEVSAIAEAMKDPGCKLTLLKVAADYLHMADSIERQSVLETPASKR